VALLLIVISKPETAYQPATMDYRGLALIVSGVGLSVLGFQQSSIWGWGNIATGACIAAGVILLVAFCVVELRAPSPLMEVRFFRIRAFRVENLVLGIAMLAFVPLFFFASEYAQISLGESASETGLYLLIFFAGFATATQWGGKMLDRIGARRPVVLGCAVGAVGFWLWGSSMTHLSVSEQWYFIVLAGLGVGLVLSPANTDALNRVARERYGEATGITQTVRNFGSSLGLAILGSLLITWNRSNLESALGAKGVSKDKADAVAECISQGEATCQKVGQALGPKAPEAFSAVPMSFAEATKDVFHGMAIALAIAFVVALKFMPSGKVEEGEVPDEDPSPEVA
jgi:predicted MFS family arabinose efflux permease